MSTNATPPLRFWNKIIYGSGEWSIASFGTLRQIFYAIFLVDVVGLGAAPRFVCGAGRHYLGCHQRSDRGHA